ncbi:hypothetical protein OQA88_8604 [Cercophora sp. LCS_1]
MATYKYPHSEPIAIVGSGCRFAGGATTPSKLWRILQDPADLTRDIPNERFNINAFYHPDGEYHGTTNSSKGYFLEQDHRVFDATFFNITPKETEAIDPQHRMLLEVVYEAMESAGYTLQQYSGKKVAVYTGLMTADYDTLSQRDDLSTSQYYATGNARSIISNRVSYFFNFNGPSMTIDTACSSSLVALHQAVLSLRSGECEMACVTGANLIITPEQFVVESNLHMLSPTGQCRMWDASANGYARGEGVAAMFVKPLSRALADGDRIEAIIRETGVNSDGRSKGITMPNWAAQSALIRDTYLRAGLDSRNAEDRCQYFEAHGTGTSAGDPNEARAIEDAFFGRYADSVASDVVGSHPGLWAKPHGSRPGTPDACITGAKILVGSVKTVIGHTEGAAGLAGLMKVVQSMKHSLVPPNLHLNKINPDVAQYCANLFVPTKAVAWPHVHSGQPKRASVNSFGFGGTNSHAIVEQYIPAVHNDVAKRFDTDLKIAPFLPHAGFVPDGRVNLPLVLSANSQKSLVAVIRHYRDYLSRRQSSHLEDVAWHTYARRTAFPFRYVVSGASTKHVIDSLNETLDQAAGPSPVAVGIRARPADERPRILGIFTGQGAQWATMSRGLLLSSKIYSDTIRALDKILLALPHPPGWSLEQEILAEAGLSRVQRAAISQPVSTAVQIALIDLLQSLGVVFSAVVGHSSGEIAAAYAAGRLSARDAILISYYRGMYAHLAAGAGGAKGAMLAAAMSKEAAAELCSQRKYSCSICVAASNSPGLVTLSGDADVIHSLEKELTARKTYVKLLGVDTAYHSPHMDLPAVKYTEALDKCGLAPLPARKDSATWISSVTGDIHAEDVPVSYWTANMVKPVLFYEAVNSALSMGSYDCAIEVGPHPVLRSPSLETIRAKTGDFIPYSGVLYRNLDDRVAFSKFLGWMWTHFASYSTQIRRFVHGSVQPHLARSRLDDIPFYPWDHSQVHYRESRISRQFHFSSDAPHELLGKRTRDDNQFILRWRNVLKLDKLPWARGHRFQGYALLPASAYLVMALDAARVALAGRKASVVELEDLAFPSGLILEEKDAHGVEVLFTLLLDRQSREHQIEGTFVLASAVADGRTTMTKNFLGKLRIHLDEPTPDALPSRPRYRAETLKANPDAFYRMMDGTGLKYTGPFRSLLDIDRRFAFGSAKLKRVHSEDKTQLRISPATLDSCLQTAFVSVSSPGDGAIWTSFLPDQIDRIRFNLATYEPETPEDILGVDTYLTKATPYSRHNTASFTAEVNIYNARGQMEVQVEGMCVRSFGSTKPADDYELYLTTITDVDPEDEIVSGQLEDLGHPNPMLIESCERVASYFISNATTKRVCLSSCRFLPAPGWPLESTLVAKDWPTETAESLEDFVAASPYFHALEFIRRLGENLPDVLPGMLSTVIEEARELVYFQNQISRIVRQVAHKYSRMNVLGFTDPDAGLTEHILQGLGESFSAFTVGFEPEVNLAKRLALVAPLLKRVKATRIDLEGDVFNSPADQQYDLVVLSQSALAGGSTTASRAVDRIRQLMRPGGFLILIDISRSPLKTRIRRCARCNSADDGLSSPADWSSILDKSGFSNGVAISGQAFHPGFSVTVRQSESHFKQRLLHPFAHIESHLTERLLVIGGRQLPASLIAAEVIQRLSSRCGTLTAFETLDCVDDGHLTGCSAIILLSDLDEPVLATMTKVRMDKLRKLLRPQILILWVTVNARVLNPDNAASLGFTRTLAAETPGLTLQVLDLESTETYTAFKAVTDTFARLTIWARSADSHGSNPLWVHEPEIYVENGRFLVPRVVPWKDGIQRINSIRRLVTNTVNTLECRVEIFPAELEDGSTEYTSEVEHIDLEAAAEPDTSMLRVHCSTAEPLYFGRAFSAYICLGRNTFSGRLQVALSVSSASYVSPTPHFVTTVTKEPPNKPLFVGLLVRYLAALAIADIVEEKPVLLVQPDPIFQECVKDILVQRGIWLRICSTDKRRCALTPGMVFIHPKSSARDVKALYPPGGAWVFNLLPESDTLSELLVNTLPKDSNYNPIHALLKSGCRIEPNDQDLIETLWHEAVGLALSKSSTFEPTDWRSSVFSQIFSVPDLLNSPQPGPLFQLVDWKAQRSIPHLVKPWVGTNMLSPHKTYVLVGITRDFGQSLCKLFVENGARHIVLASRSPPTERPFWQQEMLAAGIDVRFEALDVTNLSRVKAFKKKLEDGVPAVGGIVNGAMVLDDGVFSEMSLETWHRVMAPKTIGSKNLDTVFYSDNLEFFIMTSSFAAIGGHAGQSNYAAANMYMNGLAASRRHRGLAASVLNIGVIYGLGFLHREKENLYDNLEREGYPPISERDIHHMFIEAIAAGKPIPGQINDITTGLRRFSHPTLPWHSDPRFSHFRAIDDDEKSAAVGAETKKSLKDSISGIESQSKIQSVLVDELISHLEEVLKIPKGAVSGDDSLAMLGVDSLIAVDIRSWIWKNVALDVAVMKILGASRISKLCDEIAERIVEGRVTQAKMMSMGLDGEEQASSTGASSVATDVTPATTEPENVEMDGVIEN